MKEIINFINILASIATIVSLFITIFTLRKVNQIQNNINKNVVQKIKKNNISNSDIHQTVQNNKE